jgi:hypothetical protein
VSSSSGCVLRYSSSANALGVRRSSFEPT